MIQNTPFQKYKEIVDRIPEQKKFVKGRVVGYVLLFFNIGIVVWMFMIIIQSVTSIWSLIQDFIGGVFGLIIIGIIFLFIWVLFYPGKPILRENYAKVIKTVIGYDFGNDYTLFYTGSHDYEEYLYIFSEETFVPFRDYLDSMKDGVQEGTYRYVQHLYEGKKCMGFTLVEDRLDVYKCGNIERIIVDYEEQTLKHTFTVY